MPELGWPELQCADGETLLHQAFLARLLVMGGASIVPLRIADRVLEVCESTKAVPAELKIDIYYQLAAVFLEMFAVDRMGGLYAAFTKLPKGHGCERSFYFRLLYLQFEVFSGRRRYDGSLEREFRKLREAALPPLLSATLDYHIILNQFLARRRSLKTLLKLAKKQQSDAPAALRIYYSHLLCKLYLSMGVQSAAATELGVGSRPFYLEMESLFLRKFYLRERLTLAENVSLHCFPGLNDYSTLLGNRFSAFDTHIPIQLGDVFFSQLPALRDYETSNASELWLIAAGEIFSGDDVDMTCVRPTLDLRSGAWLKSGRRRFLGRTRSVALMTIVASGAKGANELLLSERLYRHERISLSNAVERAQNVVTQLKRLGFPIVRNKRRFYFDFKKSRDRILLPIDHCYKGEIAFLRTLGASTLDRKTVCRVLNVSLRASSLYIKEWKMQRLIASSGNRHGEYIFVT